MQYASHPASVAGVSSFIDLLDMNLKQPDRELVFYDLNVEMTQCSSLFFQFYPYPIRFPDKNGEVHVRACMDISIAPFRNSKKFKLFHLDNPLNEWLYTENYIHTRWCRPTYKLSCNPIN